jgi:acetoin utilization deacetylase AcuC-like enzyme
METNHSFIISWHPCYAHSLPEGHRFPMAKYDLIPEQLLYEGLGSPGQLRQPAKCAFEDVLRVHSADYLEKLLNQSLSPREQRVIGFPQSTSLTERELVITQGTIDCCLGALQAGMSLNVAGGTHHAFRDRGEGFCLLNDFAVAAAYLLHHRLARQVLIVDLDVHQGNGTASIFNGIPEVFTFSMHGKNNYPFRKETSDRDIELSDGTSDQQYLQILAAELRAVLDLVQPDFVFYLSGVDVLASDKFGRLGLSLQGCSDRDELVFTSLKARGLPCTVAMGGGYSPQVRTIVDAHCQTFRLAKRLYDHL